MAKKFLPTVETLRNLFNYDPTTGLILYRASDNRILPAFGSGGHMQHRYDGENQKQGMPAELMSGKGKYLEVRVHGLKHKAHQVAWALHYGEWPSGAVDHVNRDPHDNRIANLRMATKAENARNRRSAANATSKYLGVSWHNGKWRAAITQSGVTVQLGDFDSEKDAAIAYDCAAISMHREFANPNFVANPYLTKAQKEITN